MKKAYELYLKDRNLNGLTKIQKIKKSLFIKKVSKFKYINLKCLKNHLKKMKKLKKVLQKFSISIKHKKVQKLKKITKIYYVKKSFQTKSSKF